MTVNELAIIKSPSCRENVPQDGLYPWFKLAIGVVLILLFIFGIGHLSTYIPGAQRMARVIDDHDLRATAIFYTDFEASFEGSEYIRHCLEYPPRND
jgi:hypothetical protein